MDDQVTAIMNQINNRRKKRLSVGIDGLAGAGKSHLASLLADYLRRDSVPVTVIHLDDLITPRCCRYHTGHESWYEYMYLQWNVTQLNAALFEPLRDNKRQLRLPFYQWETDAIVFKQIQLPPAGVILLDGIFLQRPEWRDKLDLIVYLTCPVSVRQQRVLNRDAYIGTPEERLSKYEHRYWPAEAHYIQTCRPEQAADLVVSCEAPLL
ncbi:uridine kinase [Alkalicoccus luteus]|uniref:Uridine kinase n=1 Tax=Alkalicoccus luteus TaxID=1237094 RepID=A0A969PQL5_9BACI|nr:uridine kinase [Alkalicoccus luteus]NJP38577.1 uridine kinase [Alkalicoccus luteus]